MHEKQYNNEHELHSTAWDTLTDNEKETHKRALELMNQSHAELDAAVDAISEQNAPCSAEERDQTVDTYTVAYVDHNIAAANVDGIITPEEKESIDHSLAINSIHSIGGLTKGKYGGDPTKTPTAQVLCKHPELANHADDLLGDEQGISLSAFVKRTSEKLANLEQSATNHIHGTIDSVKQKSIELRERVNKWHSFKMGEKAVQIMQSSPQNSYYYGEIYRHAAKYSKYSNVHEFNQSIADEVYSSTNYTETLGKLDRLFNSRLDISPYLGDERLAESFVVGLTTKLKEYPRTGLDGVLSDGYAKLDHQIIKSLLEHPKQIDSMKSLLKDAGVDIQSIGQSCLENTKYFYNPNNEKELVIPNLGVRDVYGRTNGDPTQKSKEFTQDSIALLRELGFKPFHTQESLVKIMSGENPAETQKRLLEFGLIDGHTVDHMIKAKQSAMRAALTSSLSTTDALSRDSRKFNPKYNEVALSRNVHEGV